jgi:hypothetical protein
LIAIGEMLPRPKQTTTEHLIAIPQTTSSINNQQTPTTNSPTTST